MRYTTKMRGTIVGVLRGGPSREHEVSLATGAEILRNLNLEHYTPRDIYIDTQGNWHVHGKPSSPELALRSVDVVIVGLHGEYGEDGEVQKILERYGIPYSGSASFPSYVTMHKVMAIEHAREHSIATPEYRFVQDEASAEEVLRDVIRTFPQPVVVKPVRTHDAPRIVSGYAPLYVATMEFLNKGAGGVLIEKLVNGTEVMVGILENMRGEALYALPPRAIGVYPGKFAKATTDELVKYARVMHQALGLSQYSHSNFLLTSKGVHYLGTNALPPLSSDSPFVQSLESVGIALPEFMSHLVATSLAER